MVQSTNNSVTRYESRSCERKEERAATGGLPDNLLKIILGFLPSSALLEARGTNRGWNRLVTSCVTERHRAFLKQIFTHMTFVSTYPASHLREYQAAMHACPNPLSLLGGKPFESALTSEAAAHLHLDENPTLLESLASLKRTLKSWDEEKEHTFSRAIQDILTHILSLARNQEFAQSSNQGRIEEVPFSEGEMEVDDSTKSIPVDAAKKAILLACKLENSEIRDKILKEAFVTWKNPGEVLQFILTIPNEQIRLRALASFCHNRLRCNTALTLNYARRLKDPSASGALQRDLIRKLHQFIRPLEEDCPQYQSLIIDEIFQISDPLQQSLTIEDTCKELLTSPLGRSVALKLAERTPVAEVKTRIFIALYQHLKRVKPHEAERLVENITDPSLQEALRNSRS